MTEEKYLEKLLSLPHEYKVKLLELPNEYIGKLLELPEKLLKLPEQCNRAIFQQKYSRAKYVYDTAIRVVEFMNPPDEIRKQLFGDWDNNEVEISEGLFHKDLVSEAYEQCCIRLYQGYEHESYRRFGQPPQYYPQPRYPVPGYPKPK